jgi:antitoxin MazE
MSLFGALPIPFPQSPRACIFFVYTFLPEEHMRARVQKWGNSLALRIPKAVAGDTGLEQGSEVEISLENGQLVLTPIQQPALTLEDLLSAVTAENRHSLQDPGVAVGREVW